MAATLEQLYGPSATLSSGTLTIFLADLQLQGLDTPDDGNKVAAALLKRWNEATHDKTFDPTYGLVVRNPSRQAVARSGQQHISYSYNVSLYIADSAPATPDPDDLVA